MAFHYHELPVELFSAELQPFMDRFNDEMRQMASLEGAILDPRQTNRSDKSIARKEETQVAVSRVSGLAGAAVTSITSNNAAPVIVGAVNFVDGFAIAITQSGQDITWGTSAAVLGTAAGDITTIQPDDAAAIGGSTASAPVDHRHAIVVGEPVSIGNANAEGSTTSFAGALHVHDVGTAPDLNYLRRDGGTGITGILAPTAHDTHAMGVLGTSEFLQFCARSFRHQGAGDFAEFRYDDTGASSNTNLRLRTLSAKIATDQTNNDWQSAAFSLGKLIALEDVTTLDELGGPAAGNYAMGNFKLTGLSVSTASGEPIVHSLNVLADLLSTHSNGQRLDITGDTADAAAAVAIRMAWDANVATPTTGAKIIQFGYIDNGDAFQEVLAMERAAGGWELRSDETSEEFAIGIGAARGIVDSAWMVMDPDLSDGSIEFLVGVRKMGVSENGGLQLFGGMPIGSDPGNPINFRTGETSGGYGFSFNDQFTGTLAADDPLIQFGDNEVVNRFGTGCITLDGQFLAGGAGFSSTDPADGVFGASGWRRNNATDGTGSDVFVRSGRGTGDSVLKGDVHIQTPDATSSGAANQEYTDAVLVTREADMLVGKAAVSTRDVLRYALLMGV